MLGLEAAMDAGSGMFAGSRNGDDVVLMRGEGEAGVSFPIVTYDTCYCRN